MLYPDTARLEELHRQAKYIYLRLDELLGRFSQEQKEDEKREVKRKLNLKLKEACSTYAGKAGKLLEAINTLQKAEA
ncbi:MAG: hypothetical protein U5N58_10510 [Actinomycetota bacterium]|nr:hypothetical protein [Actinomycetota bacterium]